MPTVIRVMGIAAGAVLLTAMCSGAAQAATTSAATPSRATPDNLIWDATPAVQLAIATPDNLIWD